MIAGILSLLGSSAIGTLLGGLFAFLNKKADLETKKLDLAHEVNKWAHELEVKDKDLEYAKQEAISKQDVALIEADGAVETARMSAIAASHAADNVTAELIAAAGKTGWFLVIAAGVNKAIRPLLTAALAGTAIYVNILLVGKMTEGWTLLTQTQQVDASMQAFAWLTGQAAAVIGYWFVARGSSGSVKKSS